jgi:hypothetical protein
MATQPTAATSPIHTESVILIVLGLSVRLSEEFEKFEEFKRQEPESRRQEVLVWL